MGKADWDNSYVELARFERLLSRFIVSSQSANSNLLQQIHGPKSSLIL
jgi:hypothetical protein